MINVVWLYFDYNGIFFSCSHLNAQREKILHFESHPITVSTISWKGTNMLYLEIQYIPTDNKAASSHPQLSRGFAPHQESRGVNGRRDTQQQEYS